MVVGVLVRLRVSEAKQQASQTALENQSKTTKLDRKQKTIKKTTQQSKGRNRSNEQTTQ